MYSPIRLDEINAMIPTCIITLHLEMKKLFAVKYFAQKQLFFFGDLCRLNRRPWVKSDDNVAMGNSVLFRMPFSDSL